MRKPLAIVAALIIAILWWQQHAHMPQPGARSATTTATMPGTDSRSTPADRLPAWLPPEAQATVARIASGGPFEHRQDGVVFGNYEHRLPEQPRGYYHEYTVETPGAPTRGARRIITGGTPPQIYYYTADHYDSFRPFQVTP
jgi:guanyl-specific ribonuclease Sa